MHAKFNTYNISRIETNLKACNYYYNVDSQMQKHKF